MVHLELFKPDSFYTIVLKTTGWELDKEYSASGTQTVCFLATGSKDKFPIGVTYNLKVTDSDAGGVHTISVTVSAGRTLLPKPWLPSLIQGLVEDRRIHRQYCPLH